MAQFRFIVFIASLATLCSFGQTFENLHTFGSIEHQEGIRPLAPLTSGPDGLLYGTTAEPFGGGKVRGSLFKLGTTGGSFTILKQFTNALDGTMPKGSLLLSGETLYGITTTGGSNGGGTVFGIRTNGQDFRVLQALPSGSFDRYPSTMPWWVLTNDSPVAGLSLSGPTLFGVTRSGGVSRCGTIFKVNVDGSGYAVLKEFSGPDGAGPCGDPLVEGTTLFGTASFGGSKQYGTIFKINIDGSNFTVLKDFVLTPAGGDGAVPLGGLLAVGGRLVGTTWRGGTSDWMGGTVFSLAMDGSDFTVLKSFSVADSAGAGPIGRLILAGDSLIGTTSQFWGNSRPSPFALKIDGSGFTRAGSFLRGQPRAGLTLIDGVLYGSAYDTETTYGVSSGHLFQVTPGLLSTMIYEFSGAYTGGVAPNSPILLGESLYGTTAAGGLSNAGTLFRISPNAQHEVLFDFPGGRDGYTPRGRLAISGDTFYGITDSDRFPRYQKFPGTLYSIRTNGTGYRVLHRFGDLIDPHVPNDGSMPEGSPVIMDGFVYGTTLIGGGPMGYAGTIYKIKLDGTGYTIVKGFSEADGIQPQELTAAGGALFGTTFAAGNGTLFKVAPDGSFTVLHRFNEMFPPDGRLAIIGDTIYGAGYSGGIYPNAFNPGRIMEIDTNGNGFAITADLTGDAAGDVSKCGLVAAEGALFGVTHGELGLKNGSIFQLKEDGTSPALIYEFSSTYGGNLINGDLALNGMLLYGSTQAGGETGQGTIFRLDLRPRLKIQRTDSGFVISWPSYANGFSLKEATDLLQPSWVPVEVTPADDGNQVSVSIGSRDQAMLLRLER